MWLTASMNWQSLWGWRKFQTANLQVVVHADPSIVRSKFILESSGIVSCIPVSSNEGGRDGSSFAHKSGLPTVFWLLLGLGSTTVRKRTPGRLLFRRLLDTRYPCRRGISLWTLPWCIYNSATTTADKFVKIYYHLLTCLSNVLTLCCFIEY